MSKIRQNLVYRFSVSLTILCFVMSPVTPVVYAQGTSDLIMPGPGTMVHASKIFIPPVVKGVTIHPDKPFHFDFIIDKGNTSIEGQVFKDESLRLIKYFLASLAVPDDDLWVNLSPYEQDRIIPDKFGRTEMGRDLLAQDYLLKQFTASLMYPEDQLGAEFWRRVHQKALQRFGHTDIPVSTFNKVWIVPDKAVIHEHGRSAFVAESRLKVMLEEDYIALDNNLIDKEDLTAQVSEAEYSDHRKKISKEIIREVLIPEIEREVNEGQHFARLRQIYHSLLLATWYKENMRRSILNQVYSNQNKVDGVEIPDEQTKEDIYQQYVEAFQMGVYSYVKEEFDPDLGEVIPRKYFSGGMNIKPEITTIRNPAAVRQTGDMAILSTQFDLVNQQISQAKSDAAVLANDEESRIRRGQRLKAAEKVFVNQFSILAQSVTSLLSMYVQTFGFESEDSMRAFEQLQDEISPLNLRGLFILDPAQDVLLAHAPIADKFEAFRQELTINLGILRAEVQGKSDERFVELLVKMIDESVQFVERVFDEQLRFRTVDIGEEVRDYAEEFENTYGIPVSVSLPTENIGGIKIDQLRMAEVFYILLNNARESGGNIAIDVSLSENKEDVIFRVIDEGEGIAQDIQSQIFDAGFTTKLEVEGAPRGIGLSVARTIVQMHGGEIAVESEVGVGSTFSLTIPRQAEGPALTRLVLDVASEVQTQVEGFVGDQTALSERIAAAQTELFQSERDRFITLGVVPDVDSNALATFDLVNRAPHINLFADVERGEDEVSVNDRIVRHILMYGADGQLARITVDPPNLIHTNRTQLPEIQEKDLGQDLMVLSARFLTGYDSESGQFSQTQTIAPETSVLFRDAPVNGVNTLGDLAQLDLQTLGSDKAVLVNPYMVEAWSFMWDRRNNALNQNQLSKALGRNRAYINHLSKGKDIPGRELFEQILEELKVPEADRPEALRLLEVARENRTTVPPSFIELGQELRRLRLDANAYLFAVTNGRVQTESREELATLTGLPQMLIESLYTNADILGPNEYESLMEAVDLPEELREEARQKLAKQSSLDRLSWTELTMRLGFTEAYLSQVENGKMLISSEKLTDYLQELGAEPAEIDAVRKMHRLAQIDRMIINTGKTTIQMSKIPAPDLRTLVETVQKHYLTYKSAPRGIGDMGAEEIEWALYSNLSQNIYGEIAEFLEPIQNGLDFDFTRNMLRELIDNALDGVQAKYGEDYRQGRIVVDVARKGDSIIIKLQDNGQGIDETLVSEIGKRPFAPEETGKSVDELRFLGGQGTSLFEMYQVAAENDIEIRAVNRARSTGAEVSIVLPESVFLANGDKAVLASVPTTLEINGQELRLVPLTREEAMSNSAYKRLDSEIVRYRGTSFEERSMADEFSFAILNNQNQPVGYTMVTGMGADAIQVENLVVAKEFRGTQAASWLLYHTFSQAIQNSNGKISAAHWKLDVRVSGVEQRESTFYRQIGAKESIGKTNDDLARQTLQYSFNFADAMTTLHDRFRSKPNSIGEGPVKDLVAYQDAIPTLFAEGVSTVEYAKGAWLRTLSEITPDETILIGVVPYFGNASRTAVSVRSSSVTAKYEGMFRDSVNVGPRMVRGRYIPAKGGVLTLASRRRPEKLILETPQILSDREAGNDLEMNLAILSARYLSGYDSAGSFFSVEAAVIPKDMAVVLRRNEETVLFEGTLHELARQSLKGDSDKAILAGQRLLKFLDSVTGNRYQFAADLSRQARKWNKQLRSTPENGSLFFGTLPNPVSLGASSFDVRPLTGSEGHADLFAKDLSVTNFMVRGAFFKRTSRGIQEMVFRTPLALEHSEEKRDVRTNLFILSAQFLTGYDRETKEFDSSKAVVSENYQLTVLEPNGDKLFVGPIQDFAQRELINTAIPQRPSDDRLDRATLSQTQEVGGIDLTAERLNIEIRRDELGEPMPLDNQQLQNININGLIPVILNIQPVTNLPLLIGAVEGNDQQPIATAPIESDLDLTEVPTQPLPQDVDMRMSRAF